MAGTHFNTEAWWPRLAVPALKALELFCPDLRLEGVLCCRKHIASGRCTRYVVRAPDSEVHPSCINAGVPASQRMAWTMIFVEIFGSVAFLLGAPVSIVSIPSIIPLVVAIAKLHWPYGFSSIKLIGYSGGRAQFGPPG